MKIIIDIPQEEYKEILSDNSVGSPFEDMISKIIKNGIPLDDTLKLLEDDMDEEYIKGNTKWVTGLYYALGELGLVDGWVKKERNNNEINCDNTR